MATKGDSSAPSTDTMYYDALLSTTMAAYRKTMIDNIFKDSSFLAYLRQSDAWVSQDGGERIAIPLMYGDNSTVKTHGGYSTLDTTPQDGISTCFYEWAEIAGTISISRLEERKNSGEGRLLNLLQSKIKQCEMTLREKINGDLVGGTVSSATFVQDTAEDGSYGLNPLGYFFRKEKATDPTTNDVGNIAGDTYSWWRHRVGVLGSNAASVSNEDFSLNVSTWAGLKTGLRRMYNYCGRGSGGFPDLVVMDQVTFESYENALDSSVRYTNTAMADLGFDTIKLRGSTCIWDEVVPDVYTGTSAATGLTLGTAFFINTNFYKVVYDSQTNIVTTPFVTPENQTAKTAAVLFMGQATVSNMRKHGVCLDISQSLTS
jgi:hypothetical protein